MSLMSSLALVTIRSSIASPWVGVPITWAKKLSSMHSRILLDCLQLAVLLFQQMLGAEGCSSCTETLGFSPLLEPAGEAQALSASTLHLPHSHLLQAFTFWSSNRREKQTNKQNPQAPHFSRPAPVFKAYSLFR
ncbi:hypothetical protein QYF61_026460 [Mycteria americana]|uniref:Secreted protein n=1 Tax=Mycteria americana TaxID=33587 RepID=A0AAN7NBT0_MYCAM|nr:hypothetical protein QYF61_026460 [Mycteria americana]